MDNVKVQEVIGVCEAMIQKATTKYPQNALLDIEQKKKLDHCLDMVKQMRDWGPERLEKSFRWLGYIQGMMHAFDVADLDELKNMSRPTEEDEKREAAANDTTKREAAANDTTKPFRVLKAELQRRLGNLKYDSTDELLRLTALADQLEEISRRDEAHQKAMESFCKLAEQFGPSFLASITKTPTPDVKVTKTADERLGVQMDEYK